MKNKTALYKRQWLERILVLLLILVSFLFLVTKPAVFSPDSYSYLRADIYRFPGYIIFLRLHKFIFGETLYPFFVVGFQAGFGLVAVYYFYKKVIKFFSANLFFKAVLLVVLLLPFFSSLNIANEISAEALSYGLYLFSIYFSIDFLFYKRNKRVFHLLVVISMLSLTRGQFIILPVILAFLFVLRERKKLFKKKNILILGLLLLLPLSIKFIDSTYRKLVYNFFTETPYSFVNTVTLPLFIASEKDTLNIKNNDTKHIFIHSLNTIDSLQLRSVYAQTNTQKYKLFHDNFPLICNQNIHDYGKQYFYKLNPIPNQSSIEIEKTSKDLFFVLVKNHFKEWLTLYYEGMKYGFKSIFVLLFVVFMMIVSGIRTVFWFDNHTAFIFLGTLLLLSNSMVVALACHSIDRYLFYNWFFMVILIYGIFKRIKNLL